MGWLSYSGDSGDPEDAVYVEIISGGVVAGRGLEVDITIQHQTLSRRHARFVADRGADWVIDLRSTNGTCVNGRSLSKPTRLRAGDQIRLGDYVLYYCLEPPPHLAPTPIPDVPADIPVKRHASRQPRPPLPDPGSRPFTDSGRWSDVQMVGQGGMGEVFRAFDRDLAELVAIKRLRSPTEETRSVLEHLHAREASIAKTIRHPNVVQVLEDGVFDGDPYMVMQWVDGPTFDRYLRRPEVGVAEKVECLRQIAAGIDAAHAAGVVHADLKPANVLVLESNIVSETNAGILESPDDETDDGPDDASTIQTLSEDSLDAGLEEEIARRIGRPTMPAFDDLSCIGRESEFALLLEIAQEFAAGGDDLRWVLMFGEPGVGKRHLCAHFKKALIEIGLQHEVRVTPGEAPPTGAKGVWISLFPCMLLEDSDVQQQYEIRRMSGQVRELYLRPFLRGQSIRLVESITHHPPSSRAFIDAVEGEVGGNARQLLCRLQDSFEQGAWVRHGSSYRFRPEVLVPDDRAMTQRALAKLEDEEKGLRDLLRDASPLGGYMDFDTLREATGLASATLFYLLDHAVSAGYLRRDADGAYHHVAEGLRAVLESRLDPKDRLRIVKRSLPGLQKGLGTSRSAAKLRQLARLECLLDRPDRAFRHLLEGALAARSAYLRDVFLACVDEARDIYRRASQKRSLQKSVSAALEELLGDHGRGLAGIDRLRRLPTRVRIRLADFGIARKLVSNGTTEETSEGQPWGTPRYMSPEQARREPLTPASDVFSLGTMVREAFEGRHPLGKLRGSEAIQAVARGAIRAPKGGPVPDAIRPLLARMLDPEPEARPTAQEVMAELQSYQLMLALDAYP